jgi:rhodanese-related sulfurtransferase
LALSALAAAATYALHPKRPALYFEDEPLAEGEVRWSDVAVRWGSHGAVVWVDAREREKFEAGHLEGAVLLNEVEWWELLEANVETVLEAATAGRPVVVYCGTQACEASKKIATRLRDEVGVPEVYVLKGGWPALVAAGAPTAAGAEP